MSSWTRIRRHATTITLSILAAGGVIAVLVLDRGSVTTDEAEARKKNLLEAFRRDEISELVITSKGKTARVTRDVGPAGPGGQRPWIVDVNGQRYPADEAAVDQALGSLELAVFERRVPPSSVDRAALGLDRPRAKLALTMGGRTSNVTLGGAAPSPEGAVYAETEGRGVVVITAQLAAALDVDPDRLRTRSINPYTVAELRTLEIEGKGGPRRFERAPWGGGLRPGFRWNGSTKAGKVRASAPAIEGVLAALGDLQADVFLAEDEANRALSKDISITMISDYADSTNAQIDLGGACPGHPDRIVAVRRSPSSLAACVPGSILERLSEPADAFVDHKLFAAPIDAIVEVKLTSGETTLEITRKGTSFHMRSPTDRDVEAALGTGFLESLLKLDAARVFEGPPPDLASLGLDKPRATARVTSSTEARSIDGGVADEREEIIEIGAAEGDVVHLRRVEDGALLDLAADRAEALFPSEISLRSLEVLSEPSRHFVSLSITSAGRTQRLTRGDEGWTLIEPKLPGLRADDALVNDLTERLGDLHAERWVKSGDETSYGLRSPRISIEASLQDEDADPNVGTEKRALKLLLGAAATEGSFAKIDGDNAVFVAPKAIEQAADRWLVDRSTLRVDPAWIARVTLAARGGPKVELERAGDAFRIRSGEPAGAKAAERAAAIRDALSDFTAEGAVSIGESTAQEGLKDPILTIDITRASSADASKPSPASKPVRIVIGAGDVWRGTRVYYARRSDVDATFAVAQAKVKPLLDAAGAR